MEENDSFSMNRPCSDRRAIYSGGRCEVSYRNSHLTLNENIRSVRFLLPSAAFRSNTCKHACATHCCEHVQTSFPRRSVANEDEREQEAPLKAFLNVLNSFILRKHLKNSSSRMVMLSMFVSTVNSRFAQGHPTLFRRRLLPVSILDFTPPDRGAPRECSGFVENRGIDVNDSPPPIYVYATRSFPALPLERYFDFPISLVGPYWPSLPPYSVRKSH